MKVVRWGRHGGGAEVSQLGRRELPGEKVIWRLRESRIRGCPDSRTITFGRLPGQ